ncbi:hypothetical protein T459_18602 [Capsicum annuum]|uniref:Retrovirus-related Pol polyprotein from transposon TNT 1-94 n=1 Tax=Capsicum annuum TaxID=4072 RepID=A0A2G2YZ89_CAPAN|nr:hypothetical protein T459_18602 [Capsicum annuum]
MIPSKDKEIISLVSSKEFDMKDLGAAKKILSMEILRDRKNSHFKLSTTLSPKTEDERDYMSRVPYSSVVVSLIYVMVCFQPDLSYVVSAFGQNKDGVTGCAISWKATLHTTVALLTVEAEYMAITEIIIFLTKDQMFYERTKHIDVRYHFLHEIIARSDIVVRNISTNDNPTDMMTNTLPSVKFEHCLDLVSVSCQDMPLGAFVEEVESLS